MDMTRVLGKAGMGGGFPGSFSGIVTILEIS